MVFFRVYKKLWSNKNDKCNWEGSEVTQVCAADTSCRASSCGKGFLSKAKEGMERYLSCARRSRAKVHEGGESFVSTAVSPPLPIDDK